MSHAVTESVRTPKLPFFMAIAWAVLAPLVFPVSFSSGGHVTVADLLGPPTIVIAFASARLDFERRLACGFVVMFALLAILLTMAHIGNYPNAMAALLRAFRFASLLTPFVLGATCATSLTNKQINLIFSAFLAATLFSVSLGTVGYFKHWKWAVAAERFNFGRGEVFRAGGLMGDSSAFGHQAATLISMSFVLLLAVNGVGWRTRAIAAVAVVMFPVFFYISLSRAALVDVVVALTATLGLALFKTYNLKTVALRGGVALFLAIICLPLLAIAFPNQWRILMTRLDLNALSAYSGNLDALMTHSSSGRNVVWSQALDLFWQHPLEGLGYKGLWQQFDIPGDNAFLSALVDLGIFGALMLLSGVIYVTYALFRLRRTGGMSMPAAIMPSVWLGQVAHASFVDSTTFPASFGPLLLFVAFTIYGNSRPGEVANEHGKPDLALTDVARALRRA